MMPTINPSWPAFLSARLAEGADLVLENEQPGFSIPERGLGLSNRRKPAPSATTPVRIWIISPTIRRLPFFKPIITENSGQLAFHLDLTSMGSRLRQMSAVQGNFCGATDGKWSYTDPGALFKPFVRDELMDKMTSGEGQLYDPGATRVLLLTPLPIPTGFVIFRVNATGQSVLRHETNSSDRRFHSRSDHYYPVRSLSASCFVPC